MWRPLVITALAWAAGAIGLRAVAVPAEACPAVDSASLQSSATLAADWIAAAQRPDGSYLYEYNRATNGTPDDYNVVRHAGVTMSLYQFAAAGQSAYLPTADRGLAFMQANLLRYQDWAAFRDPRTGNVQLGATSLMLAGLAQRRIATADPRHDTLMRQSARFLLILQREDGAFLNRWDPATSLPVPGETSKYATGEAFWALALMHRLFPGEGWDEPARRVANYLANRRDAEEDFPFPPWPDQWAAYGLAEMAAWPGGPHLSADHAAYARRLAGRFGLLVRVESQRRDSTFSYLIRGPRARAAGMGTWAEGLTSLHRAALADPRLAPLAPAIAERARCAAAMLAARQVTSGEPRLRGAWFAASLTRMDDQQHALSALLLTRQVP